MDEPLLTIGVPVYNGEEFLGDALESLLAQSFGDFEILISDNASADRTPEICREFADRDSRVIYQRLDENLGAAANFNRVVDVARGRYFKWAAHDDLLEPSYLETCIRSLDDRADVVLSHSATRVIDTDGAPLRSYENPIDPGRAYGSDRPSQRFHELILGAHACFEVFGVIRTEALRQTGVIGHFISSDRVLIAELALMGKFAMTSEELFLSRDHGSRSVRSMTVYERAAWFDPNRPGRFVFPYWRVHLEYAKAILRACPTASSRFRPFLALGATCIRRARYLRGDLLHAMRTVFRRPQASSRTTPSEPANKTRLD